MQVFVSETNKLDKTIATGMHAVMGDAHAQHTGGLVKNMSDAYTLTGTGGKGKKKVGFVRLVCLQCFLISDHLAGHLFQGKRR